MSRTRRKKKSNKLKIVLWSLSILLVIGVSGLFVANYAIDKVLGSLAIDTTLPINSTDSEANEETPTTELSVDEVLQSGQADESAVTNETDKLSEVVKAENSNDKNVSNSNSSSNAAPPTGTVPSEEKTEVDLNSYSATVSAEKAAAIEEEVTLKEKAAVASVLLGSLSGSDLSTLQGLASGGLTLAEKKQAKDIMLEKLTEDQYNQLIGIAAKYGVSQGKQYSETIEEKADSTE